jgi:hypothetical protein
MNCVEQLIRTYKLPANNTSGCTFRIINNRVYITGTRCNNIRNILNFNRSRIGNHLGKVFVIETAMEMLPNLSGNIRYQFIDHSFESVIASLASKVLELSELVICFNTPGVYFGVNTSKVLSFKLHLDVSSIPIGASLDNYYESTYNWTIISHSLYGFDNQFNPKEKLNKLSMCYNSISSLSGFLAGCSFIASTNQINFEDRGWISGVARMSIFGTTLALGFIFSISALGLSIPFKINILIKSIEGMEIMMNWLWWYLDLPMYLAFSSVALLFTASSRSIGYCCLDIMWMISVIFTAVLIAFMVALYIISRVWIVKYDLVESDENN